MSLITYGGTLGKTIQAADQLAASGIDAEVVDLRTLRPLDTETILDLVARTHRAVIIDEGWRSGSISAEISARIMEGAFYELDLPVERICSAEVPMPYRQTPRGRRAAAIIDGRRDGDADDGRSWLIS